MEKAEKAKPLTEEQRGALIEQVENLKDIIFAKDGKSGAVKRKNEAWCKIASNVNALRPAAEQVRTVDQIRKCWENISSKGRKEISKKKKDSNATGGGPKPGDLTTEENKILNIYGDNNPIFMGENSGFDSLIPPYNAVTLLDLSSDEVSAPTQQLSPKISYETITPPKLYQLPSQNVYKRKYSEEISAPRKTICKEQLTIDVLKSELAKNMAETEKIRCDIDLIHDLRLAAAAKTNYYNHLSTKIQLETALLAQNSNVQIIQDDTKTNAAVISQNNQ